MRRPLSIQDIARCRTNPTTTWENTLYRQGEGCEKQNPQETIKNWRASIQAYDNALKLKPDDPDAAFNREFVKKRLEALKKDQQQKNCNKCNNKDKKDPKKDNQDKDNNGNPQAKNQDTNNGDQDQKSARNQKEAEPRGDKKKDEQAKGSQNAQAKTDPEKNEKDKADRGKTGNSSAKKDEVKPSQDPGQTRTARAPERRRPGQMTEEQAQNLLDSLKGDEKDIPITAQNMGGSNVETRHALSLQDRKRRDW